MKRNYSLFLILTIALFSVQAHVAQNRGILNPVEQNIAGLSIYPNPVNSGQNVISITSKLNAIKHIECYDVLGKRIFTSKITGRELSISNLNKGVYILKITENTNSETRKLVIR